MSTFTPRPTIVIRKDLEEQDDEVLATDGHRPSVVSPLVPFHPSSRDGNTINPITTAIPPSPPHPQHSLFSILSTPTTTTTEVTATTLWECQALGDDASDASMYGVGVYDSSTSEAGVADSITSALSMSSAIDILPTTTSHAITSTVSGRHHRREREMSSMGSSSGSSTGRSRSGLRLAKKERRQKAKDGHGDEAFAGNSLGESCEDEGMTEIVVKTPKKHSNNQTPQEMSDSAWATPMLSSSASAPAAVAPSKRSDLRRGKRDLMRSWLDTPALGALEQPQLDSSTTPLTSLSPPAISANYQNIDISQHAPDLFSPTSDALLSPTYGADPSISLSALLVSIGQRSPIVSMSLDDNSTATPTESCSSMSVRHSRPRDTIRSIQAMRGSASTSSSMIPPHTTPPHRPTMSLPYMAVCEPQRHLPAPPLPSEMTLEDDQEEISRTASFRRPHPPQVSFMSSASAYPNNLSRMSRQTPVQLHPASPDTHITICADDGPLSDGPPSSVDLTDLTTIGRSYTTTTHGSAGLIPTTASLSLHPGPKPRNVVTFNADAYNLDAWDADVMGLFALPTEGAPVGVTLKRDASSLKKADMSASMSPHLLSWSCSRPMVSQESDDCCQSSVSVLSSYFDQSRPNPGAFDAGPLTFSHERPQNVNVATCRYQYIASSSGGRIDLEEGGLLPGYGHHPQGGESSPLSTLQALSGRNPGSPLDGGITSFSLLLSPTITPITTQSNVPPNTTDEYHHHHHQAVRRDYLLDISGVHVDSNATSILLKGEVNSKDGSSGSMTMSRPSGSYNPSKAYRGGGGASSTSFSDIISKFVTLDTLVHQATSYTEQLANPVSDAGHNKKSSQDRWEI